MGFGLLDGLFGSSRPVPRALTDASAAAGYCPPALAKESDRTFDQFRALPRMMPVLELCMDFGALCCLRSLLEVLLLPLKFIACPWRLTMRDAVSVLLVSFALSPFVLFHFADGPMYSYWYHVVRSASMLKLYVIIGVLELAEKLLAPFNHDAAEALWVALRRFGARKPSGIPSSAADGEAAASAARVATFDDGSSRGSRFVDCVWMGAVAACGFAAQSFILMLLTVTLNAAMNLDDFSLIALLVSQNFKEVRSQVFKKMSVELLFQQMGHDTVERVQQCVYATVILLRHAQSEGFGTVQPEDLLMIVGCEVAVDFVKHFFLVRFNGIAPNVYERFLEVLLWDAARTYWQPELLRQTLATAQPPSTTPSPTAGLVPEAAAPTGKSPMVPSRRQQMVLQSVTVRATLVPNPCRRLGFVPYAYAALIVWCVPGVVQQVAARSYIMVAVCGLCVIALQLLISEVIDGAAARFVVTTGRWEKLRKKPPAPRVSQPPSAIKSSGPSGAATPAQSSLLRRKQTVASTSNMASTLPSPLFASPPPRPLSFATRSVTEDSECLTGQQGAAAAMSVAAGPFLGPLSPPGRSTAALAVPNGAVPLASGPPSEGGESSRAESPQASFARFAAPTGPPLGYSLDASAVDSALRPRFGAAEATPVKRWPFMPGGSVVDVGLPGADSLLDDDLDGALGDILVRDLDRLDPFVQPTVARKRE